MNTNNVELTPAVAVVTEFSVIAQSSKLQGKAFDQPIIDLFKSPETALGKYAHSIIAPEMKAGLDELVKELQGVYLQEGICGVYRVLVTQLLEQQDTVAVIGELSKVIATERGIFGYSYQSTKTIEVTKENAELTTALIELYLRHKGTIKFCDLVSDLHLRLTEPVLGMYGDTRIRMFDLNNFITYYGAQRILELIVQLPKKPIDIVKYLEPLKLEIWSEFLGLLDREHNPENVVPTQIAGGYGRVTAPYQSPSDMGHRDPLVARIFQQELDADNLEILDRLVKAAAKRGFYRQEPTLGRHTISFNHPSMVVVGNFKLIKENDAVLVYCDDIIVGAIKNGYFSGKNNSRLNKYQEPLMAQMDALIKAASWL